VLCTAGARRRERHARRSQRRSAGLKLLRIINKTRGQCNSSKCWGVIDRTDPTTIVFHELYNCAIFPVSRRQKKKGILKNLN
jgi:hypothetical protein